MSTDIAQTIKTFFSAYPLQTFERGDKLALAEEPIPGVFYIVEGRASQYDISPSGNEIVVNVFKAGAFFPMSSAINDTPNHYFFEASTKLVVHVAPPEAAVNFLKENPAVTFDLLSRVYRGVDGVLRRMAHLMGGDVKSRLLFELLNAAYRFGELQPDGSISVSLHQSDLARHSGLARETVSRTVQELKAAGLVQVSSAGMVLTNPGKLEEMLGNGV